MPCEYPRCIAAKAATLVSGIGNNFPMSILFRFALFLWGSPNTLFGVILGVPVWLAGGRVRLIDGALECHGPLASFCLRRLVPLRGGAAAITFGRVVIGRDAAMLARCRAHERVHVAQAELWGPLFIPAYLLASAWAWARGGDAYRDNPFEREAYGRERERT